MRCASLLETVRENFARLCSPNKSQQLTESQPVAFLPVVWSTGMNPSHSRHAMLVRERGFAVGLRMPPLLPRGLFGRTQLISCRLQKPMVLYYGRRSFITCALSSLLRQVSVGEGVSLPRPRIPVVHGTVPQKWARNTLPARSGILYRPAIEGLRSHPLPTSSTRAPEATPN